MQTFSSFVSSFDDSFKTDGCDFHAVVKSNFVSSSKSDLIAVIFHFLTFSENCMSSVLHQTSV